MAARPQNPAPASRRPAAATSASSGATVRAVTVEPAATGQVRVPSCWQRATTAPWRSITRSSESTGPRSRGWTSSGSPAGSARSSTSQASRDARTRVVGSAPPGRAGLTAQGSGTRRPRSSAAVPSSRVAATAMPVPPARSARPALWRTSPVGPRGTGARTPGTAAAAPSTASSLGSVPGSTMSSPWRRTSSRSPRRRSPGRSGRTAEAAAKRDQSPAAARSGPRAMGSRPAGVWHVSTVLPRTWRPPRRRVGTLPGMPPART